jgi:hypothetical protein
MLFPEGGPARQKNVKIPSAGADLPPVLRELQSASVVREQGLPAIVVPLPQVARTDLVPEQFP